MATHLSYASISLQKPPQSKMPQSKTLILPIPAAAFAERRTQNRTSSFATNNPQTQTVSLPSPQSLNKMFFLLNPTFQTHLSNVIHSRNTPFKCNFFQFLYLDNQDPHTICLILKPPYHTVVLRSNANRCFKIQIFFYFL